MKAWIIVASAAAAGVVIFISALGFYVARMDTIFPNVSLEGVPLSRLTLDEAARKLIDSGFENNAYGVEAALEFPDGTQLTITGNDAGFALKSQDAAREAYNYGRTGSFYANAIAFIKSTVVKTELSDESIVTLDEEFIRNAVSAHTNAFNDKLLDDAYEIGEESIVILKGAGSEPINEDDVYVLMVDTLYAALEQHGQLTASVEINESTAPGIDLEALYNKINVEPLSAYFDTETKDIADSVTGVSFDMKTAQVLLEYAKNGEQIIIPLIYTEPELTTEQLQELLFRDALSERTTYVAGTGNRLNNITLAAAAIDGKVLNPGEVFSYNETVGQRTAAKGYKEAGAYSGGATVLELGGGICQVSSTIYDCVLYADLETVERRNHSFTVSYLPLGNDATVNWGTIDFKFKNNTNYPIKIESAVTGRDLTVRILGTKLDENYIKTEYVTLSSTPYQIVTVEDEGVAPGSTVVKTDGHNGYVVETYKYLYDKDGNLISKTYVDKSTYRVQNRVIHTAPAAAEESPETPADEIPDGELSPTPDTSPSESPSESPVDEPPQLPMDTE